MLFLAALVGTALVYALWVLWVPLLPNNLYSPLLDLGKITGYRWSSAWIYLQIVLSVYGLYALGYWRVKGGHRNLAWVAIGGALFCAELIWAYPATAVDVFGYIAHGRVLAIHRQNPFIVAPSEHSGDEILKYLAFPNEPSQYGPVWALLGGGIASLARGDLLVEILAYKVVAVVAHLGSAALIYSIANRLTGDTRRANRSAYLFLWNPLLLWEMVGNAHNDGLMVFFGLLAGWLFVQKVTLLVLPAVAAGALVKIPIAALAPLLTLATWRRGRTKAVEGVLLAFLLAVAVYRPFWEGTNTLTALRRTDLFTASLGAVVRLALAPSLGLPDATTVARSLSLAAFAVVFVIALLWTIRAETAEDILKLAYFTLLGALLLGTTWFQGWYVVWPFAFGAALAAPRRHLEVALLSLGGLLQYFVFIYLWVIGVFPPTENVGVQSAAYLCIVGPLLLGVAIRGAPLRILRTR